MERGFSGRKLAVKRCQSSIRRHLRPQSRTANHPEHTVQRVHPIAALRMPVKPYHTGTGNFQVDLHYTKTVVDSEHEESVADR